MGENMQLAPRIGADPRVDSAMHLAFAFGYLGYWDQALKCARDALERDKPMQHPFSRALLLQYVAILYNYRGQFSEACGLANEATRLCTEHELDGPLALSKIVRGWARVAMGDRAGTRELEEGVTERCQTGPLARLTLWFSVLAWAQWQAAELDDAMRTLDEATAFLEAKGERFAEAELLRLRGEILLALGADVSRVRDCFERGLVIARKQRARGWELRLACSYARLLIRLERPADARALLAPVVAQIREGFDAVDLREAHALLAR